MTLVPNRAFSEYANREPVRGAVTRYNAGAFLHKRRPSCGDLAPLRGTLLDLLAFVPLYEPRRGFTGRNLHDDDRAFAQFRVTQCEVVYTHR